MPILSVTIRPNRTAEAVRHFADGISEGRTVLDEAVMPVARAGEAISPEARDVIQRLALQIAAGAFVEWQVHGDDGLADGGRSDIAELFEVANLLGVVSVPTPSTVAPDDYPDFWPWARECMGKAGELLAKDDGAAWDRVRVALERKRHLTGDEVRRLVDQSG